MWPLSIYPWREPGPSFWSWVSLQTPISMNSNFSTPQWQRASPAKEKGLHPPEPMFPPFGSPGALVRGQQDWGLKRPTAWWINVYNNHIPALTSWGVSIRAALPLGKLFAFLLEVTYWCIAATNRKHLWRAHKQETLEGSGEKNSHCLLTLLYACLKEKNVS